MYFDLDGTLLNYAVPFEELFARTLPIDPTEEMAETYSEQVLQGIERVESDPYEQAFDAVRERYDLDVNPAALATEYVELEAAATRLAPAVCELVASIADRHNVGVLTNGDGRMQRRKLAEHGLDDLVDAVLISNEIGARKPSQAIFDAARERLPAETTVYVGDTYEEDVVPAREAGFETVYVGDEDPSDPSVTARDTEALASLLVPLLTDGTER
ncbi:HAD family hydrolase [Halorubrum lipolyticum]|uniref:HAD-superfamily hydrolase, subfamily IA, variant 1 n=1 Tax=Halorubrum lipolyticum DSM 21995 TaxID=1227482 RepID=M0NY72_9EURY|nr:HAD family hydrolase [Halorubrum lipolyticum]EMA62882.1 HAD-superfamily hydrolase, subfamily IA, variant 1 [Halorubrum lipolyticum DSM 21995]